MKTVFDLSKSKKKQFVSVVVPVFNELENIKSLNRMLKISFDSAGMDYEVIYIDDFSTDGTYEYLKGVSVRPNSKISVFLKDGKKGKAYSLVEGFLRAKGDILAMVDADLQYPVTELPEMVKKLKQSDVIVANRIKQNTNFIRKLTSWGFKTVFGKMLFGMNTDVQSGMKVFTRRVFSTVAFYPKSPWTFDLEFLYRSREAGFSLDNHDIVFAKRSNGKSHVRFISQSFEIGLNALYVRLKKFNIFYIPPSDEKSMIGAGIGHKKKQFITHTTLPIHKTAYHTFLLSQILLMSVLLGSVVYGLIVSPLLTLQLAVTGVSLIYFVDAVFNLMVIWRSLSRKREMTFNDYELASIKNINFPVYSILCPLYKEAAILPQFLDAIKKLEWPKNKLDVMLLLEEDDKETIAKVKKMGLPSYVRAVIVPFSQPKTKPKACNYGLNLAKGEYIVIYDAEDVPEPMQLKKAYLGFLKSSKETVCLQAKLNYYNPKQNLLTRFFTAEYSLWFDLTLPGLQSFDTSLPLGGTSNHFKTAVLKELQGWDTFNVTEDADLGIRLYKEGYKTAVIDSTTLEEANSDVHNWLRQRSRWIKGYIQTMLVNLRFSNKHFVTKSVITGISDIEKETTLFAKLKHFLSIQLVIGSKLTFIFLNPLLWIMTISYFALYSVVGPTLESIYIRPAFYFGVFSLVFGNFLFYYYYMIGLAKRNQWELVFSAMFIPLYWIMISISGWMALYQLLFKPHYWEKTIHGLHLIKKDITEIEIDIEIDDTDEIIDVPQPQPVVAPATRRIPSIRRKLSNGLAKVSPFPYLVVMVVLAVLQVSLTAIYVNDSQRFMYISAAALTINVIVITLMYFISNGVKLRIAFSLPKIPLNFFRQTSTDSELKNNYRVLIFNWRDKKHKWAGGAEIYIHEIAENLVKQGNQVTIFCGNDRLNKDEEVINGVQVIRRGGFFTVYIWAVIYYIFRFRNKFDVVIDSENGIPFFTPLFIRKPKFLLIHHIHQDVFRSYLRFPLSTFAIFLESRLMPFVYRQQKVITVSESSRKEIMKMGLATSENITVINPGAQLGDFGLRAKTKYPSLLYLGRLKPYKNLDIVLQAFKQVLRKLPNAKLNIGGTGESIYKLKELSAILDIDKSVNFLGHVSEQKKTELLAESWVMVQPSMIEGWGITVIEANASGTPVIASKVNGLMDSVKDKVTGILITPRDTTKWATEITRLLTDTPLRKELSSEAYKWSRNFSWTRSTFLIDRLLQLAVSEKRVSAIRRLFSFVTNR